MEFADQQREKIDQLLKDLEDLTEVHRLVNEVSEGLHKVFGMTPITKTAVEAFYKLTIKLLQMALREWDLLKAGDETIIYNPDEITRFQIALEKLDKAHADYLYFVENGEIKKEE